MGQPNTEPTPNARYAERECGDCGIILPANQMVRLSDRVLAGYTKSRRRYASTRGTFGSGGTTSERYRIEATDVCPACLEARREAVKGSSAGKILFFGGGIAAIALLFAVATHGGGSPAASDAAVPVSNPSQDSSSARSDQSQALPSTDPSAYVGQESVRTINTVPSAPATSNEPAQTGADVAYDNPPAAVDCAAPASQTSAMICNDMGLRAQNTHIASIYGTLFARAAPDQRAQFANEQSAWIVQRDACDTQPCLAISYSGRLKAVTAEAWQQYNAQRGSNAGPVTSPPSPNSKQPVYF